MLSNEYRLRRALQHGSAILLFALLANQCPALTILSGPNFTPATNAPLAGLLQLSTDSASRVAISVDDGSQTWTRDFYDFTTNRSVALLGFKPGRTNLLTVRVYDRNQNSVVAAQPMSFVTAPLPSDFPNMVLLQSDPARMEPGYTLFRVALNGNRKGYETIVDQAGEVVWYSPVPTMLDIRQLTNGDLFYFSLTNFAEMDMLGQTVQGWSVPTNLLVNLHDGVPTDHGTILYLSDAVTVVSNYPTSTTIPNAATTTATNLVYQHVVEISQTNSALLNTWSLIDMLQPNRITYLTSLGPPVWDSEHGNAIIEDPSDDSLIASLRHQNAIVKFSRTTGQLAWILGPPENWGPTWQPYLLTPVGSPFGWQYGQHSPVFTPQGTLMVYDDGNYRAQPFAAAVADSANYSRAVEYSIDETTMEVSQLWDYGSDTPERLYTDKVGNAEPEPQTGNVLVTFGSVKYVNGLAPSPYGPSATMARIQEVTHTTPAEVVWDLSVTEYDNANILYHDCFVYRSYRIADLYAHPPLAVADLRVSYVEGTAHLQFSADPVRAYLVQVSSDLTKWEGLGTAAEEVSPGQFEFLDADAGQFAARYYRVVTQ